MKRLQETQGFTLIELLVVVAIIGILAAIAIPQFALYRQKGFDASAQSDLRNLAVAEEAYYAVNFTYVTLGSCMGSACKDQIPGLQTASKNVTLQTTSVTATGFTATASHAAGSTTYTWNSLNGGMQ